MEQVEVPEEEILVFPRGVVGFEEYGRYALFQLEDPMYLLQAVDDPDVGFLLLKPQLVEPSYQVPLSRDDRVLLGLRSGEQPELLSIVTLSKDGNPETVNLRAPVAINFSRGLGTQIIPQESSYPVRYSLPVSPDGTLQLDPPEARHASAGRRNGSQDLEASRC